MIALFGFFFSLFAIFILARVHHKIYLILYVGFLLRTLASLINIYIFPLPDSTNDAVVFEMVAWEWSNMNSVETFPGFSSSYFYSWILSLIYSITGRDILLSQSLNVLIGVFNIFLVWKITYRLWGWIPAYRSAWVMALFPSVVMYSSITLRESFFIFFLLFGILFVIKYSSSKRFLNFLLGMMLFFIASMFHFGAIVAVFGFLLYVFYIKFFLNNIYSKGINFIQLGLLLLLVVYWLASNDIYISKFGSTEKLFSESSWLSLQESRSRGSGTYSSWLSANNFYEFILLIPVRFIYFLFSPFPWDVGKLQHLIGVFDSFLYMYFIFLLWKNRVYLKSKEGAKVVIFILILLLVVYSIGTSNFGTAIRHRSKFIPLFLILSAPYIKAIRLTKAKEKQFK